MPNCHSYQQLSELEKIEFIGYLVHVVQTSEGGFMAAKLMIEAARETGKLAGVKIGHHEVYEQPY